MRGEEVIAISINDKGGSWDRLHKRTGKWNSTLDFINCMTNAICI